MNGFIDYYGMFELDRSLSVKEIKRELGKKSVEVSQLEGSTNPNDIQTRKQLKEIKQHIREAIKTLGRKENRAKYDVELDAAIKAGRVNRQKSAEVQNAIERARKYFKEQKYKQALDSAKEALDNHCDTDEPYEIMSRSLFMMGDYLESLDVVDQGTEAFNNAINLWWLRIRTRIMMEYYDEAQELLNQAMNKFPGNAQFTSEQAYLYLHAEKYDVAKRVIEDYVRQHPSDYQYKQYIAYNLIEISNYCYKYDTEAQLQLIVKPEDYNLCLELVTLANKYYQDDYTQDALNEIKRYGEIQYDEDNRLKSKVYLILAAIGVVLWILLSGSASFICLLLGIMFFVFKKVIDKYSNIPVWQINRDYYRGYKQSGENWLYSIASIPFDIAFSVLEAEG